MKMNPAGKTFYESRNPTRQCSPETRAGVIVVEKKLLDARHYYPGSSFPHACRLVFIFSGLSNKDFSAMEIQFVKINSDVFF
jgi:hypothetical protein